MTVKIRLPGEPLYWVIGVLTVIAGLASVPALPFDGALPTPPLNDDLQRWGKDPFVHLDSTSTGDESSSSFVELRGVIAGPSGVVAILNHDIVRVGDHVKGEIVVEITPSAVVLKRGQQVRRVVIRSFALP